MAKRISWALLGGAGVVIVALWLQIERLHEELADLRTKLRATQTVAVGQPEEMSLEEESLDIDEPGFANELDNDVPPTEVEFVEDYAEPESREIKTKDRRDDEPSIPLNVQALEKIATPMFSELYEILALDENREGVVQGIIATALGRVFVSQSSLGVELTYGEFNRRESEMATEIDAELQSILTAAELAAWREYVATITQRALEASYIARMVEASTDLSDASRDTVGVVLAQEWIAARETFANELASDANNAILMSQASEMALDRLYDLFDENDFAHAEEFIRTLVEPAAPETPQKNEKSNSLV